MPPTKPPHCLACRHARWAHDRNDYMYPTFDHCTYDLKPEDCKRPNHVVDGLYHAIYLNWLKYKERGRLTP